MIVHAGLEKNNGKFLLNLSRKLLFLLISHDDLEK